MSKAKKMLSTILTLSLLVPLAACTSDPENLGEDPNGKAETISPDQLAQAENDDPCEVASETWRCAYSENLGHAVSQVCRNCADISPDDAEAWQVCQSGEGASRWLNFHLSPMDCLACDGEFSSACRGEGTVECSPDSCVGCCLDGKCVPGTKPDVCGTNGMECKSCGLTCFAGTCRDEAEEGILCVTDQACAAGQFCMAGVCEYKCMPDCRHLKEGDSDGCGGICQG